MAIKNKCITSFCRSKPQHGNYCYHCKHEREKARDPVKYIYDTLRRNARRRGIEFAITLAYFRRFCKRTRYVELRGKTGTSASIDRKDPLKGYIPGNLQVLTLAGNTRKRWVDYWARQEEIPDDYVPVKKAKSTKKKSKEVKEIYPW